MLFRQLSAKWGDTFPTFDFVLDQENVRAGEVCSGFLLIEGGRVEWEIQAIAIDYALSLYLDELEVTQVLEQVQLPQPLVVQPGTKNIFPFQVQIGTNALLSSRQNMHYFVVHVSVSGISDHSERVQVEVLPSRHVHDLLSHLQQLGFQEHADSRYFDGYLQEFRFSVPSTWSQELRELRLCVVEEEEQLRLLWEVDLYHYLPEKEVKREWTIDRQDVTDRQRFASIVHQILQEMISHPFAYSRERYFYYRYHHPRLAQEPGAVGAQLAGRVSVEPWLNRRRQQEEAQRATTQPRTVRLTNTDPTDEEAFRDIFAQDMFDEDDD